MIVTLTTVPDCERKAEFNAAIEAARPRILGALLNGLSRGLAELPSLQLARLPRMADFIALAQACEAAYWPAGTIHAAFSRNTADAVEGVLEGDAVAVALRKWFEARKR